jgi:hypothetical protein
MSMSRIVSGILLGLGTFVAFVISASSLAPEALAGPGDAPPSKPQVFVYPEKLTSQDRLFDGPTEIEITGETTLVWVDLMPEARFGHPTEYLLVSARGTRIVKGDWWPTLNGKDLFRNGKRSRS